MKTQTTKKAIIKVWNADTYVIDTDAVSVSGKFSVGNIELPINVIDVLNTCDESAMQLFKNNLEPGLIVHIMITRL